MGLQSTRIQCLLIGNFNFLSKLLIGVFLLSAGAEFEADSRVIWAAFQDFFYELRGKIRRIPPPRKK